MRLRSQNYEYAFYYEIDRNSEGRDKLESKLTAYKTLAAHCDCMTVAFVVTEGGDLRVKTLRKQREHIKLMKAHLYQKVFSSSTCGV